MKRLLLDTHVVIWWLAGGTQLGHDASLAIHAEENQIFVSAVTAFEIELKKKLGKLDAPDDLPEQMQASSFEELPMTFRHGREAGRLPLHHKDPIDRILVGQARCEDLTIITADRALSAYDVEILRAS